MNKKRARSPEKKAQKFKRIVKEGRKLFLKQGSEGFSMRAIADKMGMQQGNLYNYVKSKRELWFAVIKEDFECFTKGMAEVIAKGNKNKTNVELLEDLAKYYIGFAVEDFNRYKMMFMTPAPTAKGIGPFEANYQPESFNLMLQVVQAAVESKEITEVEPESFTIFIWGILHGNIELLYPETLFPKSYAQKMSYHKNYRVFIEKQIKMILEAYKRK